MRALERLRAALRARAAVLEAHFDLPFARYVNALRSMNPCTAADLIIVNEGDPR